MKKGAIALLAVSAVFVAGCGGGSDTTTAALTKAEFTKQANAICKEHVKEREERFVEETSNQKGQLSNPEKEDLVANAFVEPYAETIDDLNELGLPKGEEQKVEEMIAAMEGALEKLEAEPLKGLTSIEIFEDADKAVSDYGLESCAV